MSRRARELSYGHASGVSGGGLTETQHILVVEDDADLGRVLSGILLQAGMTSVHVTTGEAALRALDEVALDAVLTDLRLPGMDGLAFLRTVKERWSDIPVIMLTAHGSIPTAVEAMRSGATDFLTKPFDREEVLSTLERAIATYASRSQEPPAPGVRASGLLGESEAMHACKRDLERAAQVDSTVLFRGETGTGKEVAARALHTASRRAAAPFVAVHCAALPDPLLESELFGYRAGAFTGATHDKPGRVALAEGGTLFLDEIGDVSLNVQVKLLRLIQEKEFQPLGGTERVRTDVRFVAATHQDLDRLVEEGEFREDLYYRLTVLPVWLPPLRARGGDIRTLAETFLDRLADSLGQPPRKLTDGASARLEAHDWPGNVRELENIMERLVVFSDDPQIDAADVERELERPRAPFARTKAHRSANPKNQSLEAQREAAEQSAVREALERSGGNRTQAARLLGISRRTLYNRLKDFDLL